MFIGKKGSGHVEIILSSILFFSFLGGAIYVFGGDYRNPGGFDDIVANEALDEIIKRAEVNMKKVGIRIDDSFSSNSIEIQMAGSLEGVRVEDVNGNFLNSELSGNNISVKISDNDFIYLYIGEIFESGAVPDVIPNEENYEISSVSEEKWIYLENLEELGERYNEDYESLKNDLNVPSDHDFGFGYGSEEYNEIYSKESSNQKEVISINKRIQTVNSQGLRNFESIFVRVW